MDARETEVETMTAEITVWIFVGILLVLLLLVWCLIALRRTHRRARQAGFKRISDYMLAAPRNDQEKREAVNMAFRGLALCVIGIVLTPLLLLGVFPLYYGGRKISLALLGLDLLDEDDHTV
jgi:thiosulfate reductase cytochrome b subunit